MNKEQAIATIRVAIGKAEAHLAGDRDPKLTREIDSQVTVFISTLKEMESSLLEETTQHRVPSYMIRAIADAWPLQSELGNVIIRAEEAYVSVATS